MTKDELKDKIKILVQQVYKPKILSGMDTISLDSSKFPVLDKFPQLKKIIIDLLTEQYDVFIKSIEWVAPRPTTFRIVLANDETFILVYYPRSWVAQIEGKKYYLLNLNEEEQAAESISRILSHGKQQEDPTSEEGSTEAPETGGGEETEEIEEIPAEA
jgi:hypothetical protein